ncbi:MAG: hypothetical protein AB7F91_17155 [Parvularculaceae bacterium]
MKSKIKEKLRLVSVAACSFAAAVFGSSAGAQEVREIMYDPES